MQPPLASLEGLMSEEEKFHVDQMTACTFTGSKEKLEKDLKQLIDYSRIDELMITSPIFDHQDKMKSLKILKEVIDNINKA